MPSVRIHEVYDSIQGESTLAGMPCTLVRLAGCPLRCRYCDTPQAWSFERGTEMAIDAVVADIAERDRPLVLVSGGEPLAQPSCMDLLAALVETGRLVQLETSGAFDISEVPAGVRRILDIKTPGSGEAARNLTGNLAQLRAGDEIKFVITDRADYEWARALISEHAWEARGLPVLLSPSWGELEAAELAAWVIADRLPARLHLQQHKVVWGSEARGV
jgi:7-carboxy-7-deazaguanine synthase